MNCFWEISRYVSTKTFRQASNFVSEKLMAERDTFEKI